MKHLDVVQGSKEWFQARLGIPTASEFDKILTPGKLTLSSQADKYLNRLLAEWALQTQFLEMETKSWAMDRGIELEQEADDYYAFATNLGPRPCGFCLTDDGLVGCSPDRLVADDGLIEIKCPLPPTHMGYLRAGTLPDAYRLQVQGELFVTGRAWADFLSYCPQLPPLLIRIEPDPRVHAALGEALGQFCHELEQAKHWFTELRGKI